MYVHVSLLHVPSTACNKTPPSLVVLLRLRQLLSLHPFFFPESPVIFASLILDCRTLVLGLETFFTRASETTHTPRHKKHPYKERGANKWLIWPGGRGPCLEGVLEGVALPACRTSTEQSDTQPDCMSSLFLSSHQSFVPLSRFD